MTVRATSLRPRPRALARALALLPLSWAALGAGTPAAHAIYGPAAGGLGADLVSVDLASDEQANGVSSDAAISANGRYVVFQTTATNFFEDDGETEAEREAAEPPGTLREGGIFRYDRLTGHLQLVASGNLVVAEGEDAGTVLVRGAANPSVSADGRYVAFSTAEQLLPLPRVENESREIVHEESVQVYERDMQAPAAESGAYRLVSVPIGAKEPTERALFAKPTVPNSIGNPGAEVWPNTSISANGRYVAFRSQMESNLDDAALTDTPAHQLFVRDVEGESTTLVSRNATTGEPVKGPAGVAGPVLGPVSISADGSTVAWVSTDAEQQTRFLLGENEVPEDAYYLWRRWQPQESGAVTRRITGMSDPEDPECPPEGSVHADEPTASGPCYGPLTEQESSGSSISSADPGLSADGYTVAFLASPGLRPDVAKPGRLDLFLTSMRPGVTRKAGTSELTLAANGSGSRALPSIESLALSADGTTIAFTTLRDLFVLGAPAPVGTFSPVPLEKELYVVHLAGDTLERALLGFGGGEPDAGVAVNPTLSENGSVVAFVSGASNMVFGDGHEAGFNDAFTANLQAVAGGGGQAPGTNAGSGGFSLTGEVSPELGVRVKRGRAGEVVVLVETPGPGRVEVKATGTILTTRAGGHGRSKHAKPRARRRRVVLARSVASAPAEGTTSVTLRLPRRYASALGRTGRLKAALAIEFLPPSGSEVLSAEASATFYGKARRATRSRTR